jgi:GntR family transcriptional repressor for pyruvate dehydrogenase complex
VTARDASASNVDGAEDSRLGAFHPIRVRSAADEVIAVLADAIRGGLYNPGDSLPRQADLAGRLEVSRAVLRDALEVLRRAGVVAVKRGNTGGVRVVSTDNLSSVIASVGGEVHANLRAALEARRPVETQAAVLVARRAEPDVLTRLSDLVDAQEAEKDPEEFLRLDQTFHYALAQHCGNVLLGSFVRTALDHVVSTTAEFPVGRARREDAIANQRRTLEAIVSADVEAVRAAMDAHLVMLEEAYIGERLAP